MKILVNFKQLKKGIEEFPFVEILDKGDVFIDLPIAVAEFGKDYERPVLYGQYKGIPTIHEAEDVVEILKQLKVFHFKNDNGRLIEVDENEADISARLPIDTDISQLAFQDGQIYLVKNIEEGKDE